VTKPNGGSFSSFATSGLVGLTPSQANGIWTLEFRDGQAGDTGTVYDATLNLNLVPEPLSSALTAGAALLAFAGYRRLRKARH